MDKLIRILFKNVQKSSKKNEFPIAAIIYKDNKIISTGYNKRNKSQITTDHAEIIAIQKANKRLKTWRLNGYSMIITLEPCDMCKNVIKESRIDKVYYLIPRLNFKQQFKSTKFELLQVDKDNVENYKKLINHFFDNKR